MKRRFALAAVLPLALSAFAAQSPQPPRGKTASPPKAGKPTATGHDFLKANCIACHNATTKEGNLDLSALPFDPNNAQTFGTWVKIHDRVRDGEMPPKGMPRPSAASQAAFLKAIAVPMIAADEARARREGRSIWRRMNRYEYENTLRDLLDAPWLQIKDMLPEDGEAYRFNKVGKALDVSYVHMSRYLAAAEFALREAMAQQAARPEAATERYYARQMRSFIGPASFSNFNGSPERATFPLVGCAADIEALDGKAPMAGKPDDAARREEEAFGVVASAYEPLEPKFDRFRAPVAGRYTLRVSAYSFWAGPESAQRWWRPSRHAISEGRTVEPVTIYAESGHRNLRKLASFDVHPAKTAAETKPFEVEVYLRKGETIRPDAVRLFRSRPPGWRNPLAVQDGQPGVAFRWLEVQGPVFDAWPTKGHRLLFGDLPVKAGDSGKVEVVSQNPDADAPRLLRSFITRAYRRPVTDDDVQPFLKLVQTARNAGDNFTDAMITAYSAVLCSPAFVTLEERPGLLDDAALATRLAYFLWNSEPDAELRTLAKQGALKKPAVLRAQTERMLADPRSKRFVEAFLDYWLDLRKANNVSPDEILYPDYYLDDFLVESAVDETQAFFTELLRSNLPARNLVDSNFVMVNQRLAELYGLPNVQGAGIRKVTLPKDSVRGGLLTQASVLKVTANGTTTSPVLRGVWIAERVLGQEVPPPPASVPAVEPDTRGATTIREQLAKHRSDPACNSCHVKIDPAGFALENFDVVGGWRERYRALGEGGERPPGRGKNGQPFTFYPAQTVDPSGVLPDGRAFKDVRELKRLLARDERQIARNLARQLVTYATGAPVRFGDRPRIEAILDRTKTGNYGVKSLIYAIVDSELFRSK
jgi:mono/diheme cytochrome c family protein